ncbi:hypothetical protein GCM10023185_16890 [Hymenobacter saemangeumensis]|uniref:Uncharacterized protein n=1 Tax=Hymenobacter saemangeumensis TaxID=1084522 RepID=A0ABP8IAY5_9BACT
MQATGELALLVGADRPRGGSQAWGQYIQGASGVSAQPGHGGDRPAVVAVAVSSVCKGLAAAKRILWPERLTWTNDS